MRKCFFSIVVLLLAVATAARAQRYEVDLLFDDSVTCVAAVWNDSAWASTDKEPGIVLRQGDVVDSCGVSSGSYCVTFEREGRKYQISKAYLRFSDDNPEGTVNPLSDRSRRAHSAPGHFFATMAPACIVVALLLLVLMLAVVSVRLNVPWLRRVAVVAMPAAILVVALIEIGAYYYLGSDAFWWCDYDRHGFFGSLLRVIPFGLVVAGQICSIRLFEMVLFRDEPDYSCKSISVKPAAIGLGACLPVTIAYFVVVQVAFDWRGTLVDALGVVIFFATLAIGVLVTARRNVQAMGARLGIPVTAFTVIYLVGCIIAAFAVLVVLIQLIVQVLMVVFGFIIMSLVMSKRRYVGRDGRIYEEI